jgi:hypothetical protein
MSFSPRRKCAGAALSLAVLALFFIVAEIQVNP